MFEQRPMRGPTSTRVSVGAWSAGPTSYAYAPTPAKAVEIEAQGAEDRETTALRELLDAFPGFSLGDIALAYTEVDSDVNAAAVLLTTRQPTAKSTGGNDVRRNLIAEKKNHGIRKSAEQSVVGSDDLLMEKYGIRVGEIINRDSSIQSNSLFHNMQSAHDGASACPRRLNSPTRHGVRWDNESWGGEVMNEEGRNGDFGDGALLLGRKKTKQKSWGGLEDEVEQADTAASREAAETLLLSMLGESFQLGMGVVRDVLGTFLDGANVKLIVYVSTVMHVRISHFALFTHLPSLSNGHAMDSTCLFGRTVHNIFCVCLSQIILMVTHKRYVPFLSR